MKALRPFDIELSGKHLVEASAGTGKTYSIASLYVRLLVETKASVENLLVVTFTEAATKELRDRLLKRIRDSLLVLRGSKSPEGNAFLETLKAAVDEPAAAAGRLEEALYDFDRAAVYTIHGFCSQVLQDQAFESGALFNAEFIGEDREIAGEVMDDFWRGWIREVTENPRKRPLHHLLRDRGIDAGRLTSELAPHTGKPYLELLPEASPSLPEGTLDKLYEVFLEMRHLWEKHTQEIRGLMHSDPLSNYRESWVEGWLRKMEGFLSSPVPPIDYFERMDKFSQSVLDDSLRKGEEGPAPQHPFFDRAERYTELADRLKDFPVLFRKRAYGYLLREMEKRKEELGVYAYDDMLLKVRDALQHPDRGNALSRTLRSRYRYALVDEFQDTDPVQYDIFSLIYGEESEDTGLFLIGDPKQSIYGFRGADVFTYLAAKRSIDEEHRFRLEHNYRSVPELIGAVNRIFGRQEHPFILDDIGFVGANPGRGEEEYVRFAVDGDTLPPMQFRLPAGEESLTKGEADQVAAEDAAGEIARLLSDGDAAIGEREVRAGDIAVLVYTHRQAQRVAEALDSHNIHSVEFSRRSVFDTEEAAELQQVLRAVANPGSESLVRAALSTRLFHYGAGDLLELQEDERKWLEELDRFRRWSELWGSRGFGYLFRTMLLEAGMDGQLMKREHGERRVTNLTHLGELLQEEERANHRGSRNLLKWMARRRSEASSEREEELIRLESDEALIQIVTMHRSKGLEYPVVFCPYLWRGPEFGEGGEPLLFHRGDGNRGQACLDLGGSSGEGRQARRFRSEWENLAESVRLAYVAMTRARQRCCVTWIGASRSEFSPLGLLLQEVPRVKALLEEQITGSESGLEYRPGDPVRTLRILREGSPGLIDIAGTGSGKGAKPETAEERPALGSARRFTGKKPQQAFRISSFSSLAGSHRTEEEPGFEYLFGEEEEQSGEEPVPGEASIFDFPRGPRPGTCLHNIFEKILAPERSRYPEEAEEVVRRELKAFGIGLRWRDVVNRMVDTVMSRELKVPGNGRRPLRLGELERGSYLPEMEFHFRTGRAESGALLEQIRDGESAPGGEGVREGFMRGFIDLTVCHEERYYLLDYKSNHLGGTVEDYGEGALREEVRSALYDLQYHLYTVALHRYLDDRLPDYRYESHFGGVWYLFLRGLNPEGQEGIFYDRPSEGTVKALNAYLEGGTP